jgi:hypothetical protein
MFKFFIAIMVLVCGMQSAWADNRAKILYSRISSTESSLSFSDASGGIILGVSTYEKSIDGLLCRKTQAVVPNPVPSYNCWVRMNYTAAQFKSLYLGLKTTEYRVAVSDAKTGLPLVGSSLAEKSGQGYFCQKRSAVVPNPVPSYTCWKNLANVK